MATQITTKQQLLDELRANQKEVLEKLTSIPLAKFEEGCYESGWNGRQILAHIAAIEWTYPRLIELARSGPPQKKEGEAKPAQRTASGGIDAYNQRSIERYADVSAEELIEVFRTNRETTIAAVEATEDDLFAVPIKSAGGIPGPLGTVLKFIAVLHVAGHVNDIAASASK